MKMKGIEKKDGMTKLQAIYCTKHGNTKLVPRNGYLVRANKFMPLDPVQYHPS